MYSNQQGYPQGQGGQGQGGQGQAGYPQGQGGYAQHGYQGFPYNSYQQQRTPVEFIAQTVDYTDEDGNHATYSEVDLPQRIPQSEENLPDALSTTDLPTYADVGNTSGRSDWELDGKKLSSYPMGGNTKQRPQSVNTFTSEHDLEAQSQSQSQSQQQRRQLQTQIDTTVTGLRDNINRLGGESTPMSAMTPVSGRSFSERGPDGNKMGDDDDDYASISQGFGPHVHYLRKELWYKDFKLWLFIIGFLVIVVIIVVVPIEATK